MIIRHKNIFAISILVLFLVMPYAFTEDNSHNYDEADCKQIKEAVSTFLYLASKKFDKLEELEKEKPSRKTKKVKEKTGEEAYGLSGLAANYATVYGVFCK